MSKAADAGKKVQLKYVESFQDRHGKWRWYYRQKHGGRVTMPDPGDASEPTDEFMQLYKELLAGRPTGRAPAKRTPTSFVYFALRGQRVKIGYSKNPMSRLSSLKTGSHARINLYYMTPGGRELERELHDRFRHLRVRGEWFLYAPEIKEWIADDEKTRLKIRREQVAKQRERVRFLPNHPSPQRELG